MKEDSKRDKFYNKWWFWLMCMILIGIIFSSFIPIQSDCSLCESDLLECHKDIEDIIDSWNNYADAYSRYCELDSMNPLCEVKPEIIEYIK